MTTIKGLALTHALTTETPAILRAIEQQQMVAESIAARGLVTSVPEKAVSTTRQTKVQLAEQMFREIGTSSRLDVIEAFVRELGLTKAGATTYYSRLKAKYANGSTE